MRQVIRGIELMFELHGVYSPHKGMESALPLWRKIRELRKKGKKIVFMGIEGSAYRTRERAFQEVYQADREYLQRQLRIHKVPVERIQIGPESLTLFGRGLRDPIPEDVEEQHGLFTNVVAGLHDLPLHALEYARKKTVKKTRRLARAYMAAEQRLLEMAGQRANADDVLRQARRYYFDTTNMSVSRHGLVAKNLVRLAKDPAYREDGIIVLQFGASHIGLEKFLEQELRKRGVAARAAKPERHGITPTLWEQIVERRVKNPHFRPTDEEIARGVLHFFISISNPPTMVQRAETRIKKMSYEKVKETLTALLQQNAALFNQLMDEGRRV